ncbi:hypothetical protein C8J57DRAFT_1735142 [Mycena rebaudengoi]|nr:hypothetical protein C8J57DRAFT_1735142 [Mycena rebaudengoi]
MIGCPSRPRPQRSPRKSNGSRPPQPRRRSWISRPHPPSADFKKQACTFVAKKVQRGEGSGRRNRKGLKSNRNTATAKHVGAILPAVFLEAFTVEGWLEYVVHGVAGCSRVEEEDDAPPEGYRDGDPSGQRNWVSADSWPPSFCSLTMRFSRVLHAERIQKNSPSSMSGAGFISKNNVRFRIFATRQSPAEIALTRLSSFRGPSTPSASPVPAKSQQQHHQSPGGSPSSLRLLESAYHRKLRGMTETWDDLVLLDGLKAARSLVDARTDLDNALALVPDGEQPRTRVVGPKLALMEKRIAELDRVTAKLYKPHELATPSGSVDPKLRHDQQTHRAPQDASTGQLCALIPIHPSLAS